MAENYSGLSYSEAKKLSENADFPSVLSDEHRRLIARLESIETPNISLYAIATRKGLDPYVYSAIARNHGTTEEILQIVAENNPGDGYLERDIINAFARSIGTNPYGNVYEPYPDYLKGSVQDSSLNMSGLLYHNGKIICQDLWHDMHDLKLFYLVFEYGSYNNIYFGPEEGTGDVKGIDPDDPAAIILSEGIKTSWVNRKYDLDIPAIEKFVMESIAPEYLEAVNYSGNDARITDDQLYMLIKVIEKIEHRNDPPLDEGYRKLIISALETNYHPVLLDPVPYSNASIDLLDWDIGEAPSFDGPRYKELSETERGIVIQNIIVGHQHWFMQKFGVSEHLLDLIFRHPDTTMNQRQMIRDAFPSFPSEESLIWSGRLFG